MRNTPSSVTDAYSCTLKGKGFEWTYRQSDVQGAGSERSDGNEVEIWGQNYLLPSGISEIVMPQAIDQDNISFAGDTDSLGLVLTLGSPVHDFLLESSESEARRFVLNSLQAVGFGSQVSTAYTDSAWERLKGKTSEQRLKDLLAFDETKAIAGGENLAEAGLAFMGRHFQQDWVYYWHVASDTKSTYVLWLSQPDQARDAHVIVFDRNGHHLWSVGLGSKFGSKIDLQQSVKSLLGN
jgi:hypothetical protein